MNRLRRSRFEMVSGPASLFQVFIAVSQRRDTVLRGDIYESGERRLAQLTGAPQRDLIFAIKFQCLQLRGFLGEVALFQTCGPQTC
jgi:hypothetical protein